MTKDLTTIQLSKAVREQLKKLGLKGETYDDIIRRLIKISESNMKRVNLGFFADSSIAISDAAESNTEGEKPSIDTTKISERPSEIQQIARIENLLKDTHKKFKGKFKDWKEENHEADELLLRLAKEEEPHENH